MKLAIFILAVIAFLFSSCKKLDLSIEVPNCIKNKIRKIKNQDVQNPPAQVWEWKVDGETYYYFTSDCCDQFNYLYDNNCKEICAPDGGFTGGGDGNCLDFNSEVQKTLVWKDNR